MRVLSVSADPIHSIPYLQAGATGKTVHSELPVLLATVDYLPSSLEALVCTGDLQGIGFGPGKRLLGEVVAEELSVLLEIHEISPNRTGILLSGDFYSAPEADKRGVSGDVRSVWEAFLRNFRWVAGVLGNHDQFSFSANDSEDFLQQPNLYHLDGNCCKVDGLKIAGIGGIIGNPDKALRRSTEQFLNVSQKLRRSHPDLRVQHLGPSIPELGYLGSDELNEVYSRNDYPLTIFGHVYWPVPFAELPNGNQLLNVDSRVVILKT